MDNIYKNNCVTLQELKKLMADLRKDVKIIDVRSVEEYKQQHIPTAVNIEISNLSLANLFFDKEDIIVTVCGNGGGRSIIAVGKLKEMGFVNVNWLIGGTHGWFQ